MLVDYVRTAGGQLFNARRLQHVDWSQQMWWRQYDVCMWRHRGVLADQRQHLWYTSVHVKFCRSFTRRGSCCRNRPIMAMT